MSDSNVQQKEASIVTAPATPVAPKRLRSTSRGSLADLFRDWSELLAAVAEHGTDLPALEAQRTALQAALVQCQALSVQQNALTASSQLNTQVLQEAVQDGRRLASRVRAGIKAQFGFDSQRLVQFGTKPLGRRRATNSAPPAPVTPASPE